MNEEIAARAKAATPGPWENAGVNRWWVVAPRHPKHGVIADFGPTAKLHREREANREFIAHAREDIPYLLAQLRDREEKLEAHKDCDIVARRHNQFQRKLEAVKEWRRRHDGMPEWLLNELDRILKGGD